ncbi:MAG: hypothetical protein U1F43_17165 [Myxococcota bacterium]
MPKGERLGYRFLERGAEIHFARFAPFSLVFLLAELPTIVGFAVDPSRPPGLGAWTRWSEVAHELLFDPGGRALALGLALALQLVGTAVVLLSVLHALDGTPISLAESARRGLRRILPLMCTGALVAALVLYACILWVVPGLLAMTYLSLAVAVCAAERASPMRAVGRSGDLASLGLGPLFVVVLATFLVPRGLEVLLGVVFRDEPALAFALVLPLRVVAGGLGATLLAVAYHELRRMKDGTSAAGIIAAFE